MLGFTLFILWNKTDFEASPANTIRSSAIPNDDKTPEDKSSVASRLLNNLKSKPALLSVSGLWQ